MSFANQDPTFRLDILATSVIKRVIEIKAPQLLPMHDKLSPYLEKVASDLVGPDALRKRMGLKVSKVKAKRAKGKVTA